MKTLDEVIKALEHRCSGCGKCPYCEEQFCRNVMDEDALHYLREYRGIQDEYLALKDWYAERNIEENDPLGWDDLTQMIGKPVWVIDANNKGRWYLVKAIDEEAIFTDFWGNSGIGYPKDFGKAWQAYRKERS